MFFFNTFLNKILNSQGFLGKILHKHATLYTCLRLYMINQVIMKTLSALLLGILLMVTHLKGQDCEIFNVFAEAHECSNDGTFLVDIEFDFVNPVSDSFEIRGNATSYGFFAYGQTFYTIGPLLGNCETLYEFVVIDAANSNCSNFYEFNDPICCGDSCLINEIVIDSIQCNDNGTYNFVLNFNHQNTTNAFFDVFADTTFIGFFQYDNLPVFVENFIPRNSDYDLIRICDNDNPDCCAIHEFLQPECPSIGDCSLRDLFVEVYCDSLGRVFADFEFISENTGNQGFVVRGNGVIYGNFSYGQTFYTIGPLENCSSLNELIIIDQQFPDCRDAVEFEAPECCVADSCGLYNLKVEFTDCDGEFFGVNFSFLHENTGASFTVRGNGNVYGHLAYNDDNFYSIGPFNGCEDLFNELVIIDTDDPDCFIDIGVTAPNCCEGDCELFDFEVLGMECIGDSTLVVVYNFEHVNSGNLGFDLFVNDDFHSFNLYEDNNYISEIYADNNTPVNIKICDNDDSNCCIDVVLECQKLECELESLTGLQTECIDGEYFYVVTVSHNFGNNSLAFTLLGNGNNYGNFQLSDLPVTLGPFNVQEQIDELSMVMHSTEEECALDIALDPSCETLSNAELFKSQFKIKQGQGYMILDSESDFQTQGQLYSIDGKRIHTFDFTHTTHIDTYNYPLGIYLLVVKMNQEG